MFCNKYGSRTEIRTDAAYMNKHRRRMKRRQQRGTEKAARVAFIETETPRVEPESCGQVSMLLIAYTVHHRDAVH